MFGNEVVNDLPPAERGIAMVFQSYALYPHMTVKENMAFGLKLAKVDAAAAEERSRTPPASADHTSSTASPSSSRAASASGSPSAAHRPRPRVFLFDEPLSNLDAALRVQMRSRSRSCTTS